MAVGVGGGGWWWWFGLGFAVSFNLFHNRFRWISVCFAMGFDG